MAAQTHREGADFVDHLLQRLMPPRYVTVASSVSPTSGAVLSFPMQAQLTGELDCSSVFANLHQQTMCLPELTVEYSRVLLQISRPVRVANGHEVTLPPCQFGKECEAFRTDFRRADPTRGERLPPGGAGFGGVGGAEAPPGPPTPFVGILFPDEIDTFMRDGTPPKQARPCLMCLNRVQHEWCLYLRCRLGNVLVHPMLIFSVFQYRLGGADGFDPSRFWKPLAQKPHYDGFARMASTAVPHYTPTRWFWTTHPHRPGVWMLDRSDMHAPPVTVAHLRTASPSLSLMSPSPSPSLSPSPPPPFFSRPPHHSPPSFRFHSRPSPFFAAASPPSLSLSSASTASSASST